MRVNCMRGFMVLSSLIPSSGISLFNWPNTLKSTYRKWPLPKNINKATCTSSLNSHHQDKPTKIVPITSNKTSTSITAKPSGPPSKPAPIATKTSNHKSPAFTIDATSSWKRSMCCLPRIKTKTRTSISKNNYARSEKSMNDWMLKMTRTRRIMWLSLNDCNIWIRVRALNTIKASGFSPGPRCNTTSASRVHFCIKPDLK